MFILSSSNSFWCLCSLTQQSQKGQDDPDFGQSLCDNLSLRQKGMVVSFKLLLLFLKP